MQSPAPNGAGDLYYHIERRLFKSHVSDSSISVKYEPLAVQPRVWSPSDTCAGSFKCLGNIDYEVAHPFQFIQYVNVIYTGLVVLPGRFYIFNF